MTDSAAFNHDQSGQPLTRTSGRQVLIYVAVSAAFALILLACFLPAINSVGRGPRAACPNNLKQIGIALASYESEHGCFPPAFTVDEAGRPMHSWRALLIPFLEIATLEGAYHFDEPWDSPSNRRLLDRMPNCFRCPKDVDAPPGTTSYVAITGPNTAFPGRSAIRVDQITDGIRNTIAVVEMANSRVPWTCPSDVDIRYLHTASSGETTNPVAPIGGIHVGGMNCLFADGSTHFIAYSVGEEMLRALLTATGGEEINETPF